jgi:Carboxypeptidase regulatory-like domain
MVEPNDGGSAKPNRISVLRAAGGFVAWILLVFPSAGYAEAEPPALGTSGSGMHGLVFTGLPLSAPELNLSFGAGYGMTEAVTDDDGAHHRGQATFGAAYAPLPWLSFALRLDGRLEFHPDDGEGAHMAGFGDPRIFARAGHALSPELSIGGELGAWFPGTDAPSIEPTATSAEVRGLFAYAPRGTGWRLLAAAGFRFDNSARSAPDLERLRLGDRVTLGVSDSHAVLGALGLAHRFRNIAEVFGEVSADVLVGSKSPGFGKSPLRAAVGGRYFPSEGWQVDLTAITSLSSRPDIEPEDALVPIEPRVLVMLGARYSFDFSPKTQAATPDTAETPKSPEEQPKAAAPAEPKFATVAGTLVDDKGEPLPEAVVTLRGSRGETRDAITDAHGQYTFQGVPVGPAAVEVEATGFKAQTWDIEVRPDMPPDAPRALSPKTDTGVLRGLIRTFQSEPLRAQILVRDRRGRSVATRDSAEDGHFELDLAPGAYDVTISAKGYRTHRRSVKVEANGVSILNVDMREGK